MRRIPISGSILNCQQCFAENEKSELVEHIRSRMTRNELGKNAAIIACCTACSADILIFMKANGSIEAADVDPYKDVEQTIDPVGDIPDTLSVRSEKDAFVRYKRGEKYFSAGNYKEAYTNWRAAYHWHSSQSNAPATACVLLNNMGMALNELSSSREALSCLQTALLGINQAEKPEQYATVLNNIGVAHVRLGNMSDGERYHRQAYQLQVKGGNEALITRERANLAFSYAKMASRNLRADELDNAIQCARRAAALYEAPLTINQGLSSFLMLGNLLRIKAEKLRRKGALDEALGCYEDALRWHMYARAHELLLLEDWEKISWINRKSGRVDQALNAMEQIDKLREKLPNVPGHFYKISKRPSYVNHAMRRIGKRVLSLFQLGNNR